MDDRSIRNMGSMYEMSTTNNTFNLNVIIFYTTCVVCVDQTESTYLPSSSKLDVDVFYIGKNSVVKITRSNSEVVLRTIKHMIIYHGSGPSLEVIALHLDIDIEDEHMLQRGEQRAREVHVVKGEMDLVPLPEG
jgi:hypothetical protein